MSDLQAKFAVTLVALGFFMSYALPAMKDMKQHHDAVIQQVGQPYAAPAPSNADPAGNASFDDARK